MAKSWLGINQISAAIVKRPGRLVLTFAVWAACSIGAVGLSAISDGQLAHADEVTPDIEAKAFDVTVVRKSAAGRVYLFQTPNEEALHIGKILLLRHDEQPVMGFRVLRDYPQKNQFAAKWVRRYRGTEAIAPGQTFNALEKLADREAPPLTDQDHHDLKELESDIPAPSNELPNPGGQQAPKSYDSELDKGTTPPPKGSAEQAYNPQLTPADERDIDDLSNLTAEEFVPLDRNYNWFTIGFGYFHNNGAVPNANSGYFTGFDIKYARTLKQLIYFHKKDVQDSLALEFGLGYYKPINFAESNDSYSVIPLTVTFRYNVILGENITTFIYAGVNKNVAFGSSPNGSDAAVTAATTQLNSLLPAAGLGLLFRVGPGWYMRVDAGVDLIGLALLLRY